VDQDRARFPNGEVRHKPQAKLDPTQDDREAAAVEEPASIDSRRQPSSVDGRFAGYPCQAALGVSI
jgi:hypothetical protein